MLYGLKNSHNNHTIVLIFLFQSKCHKYLIKPLLFTPDIQKIDIKNVSLLLHTHTPDSNCISTNLLMSAIQYETCTLTD